MVRPLLKKRTMDLNDPASYRPISNLSFLSNVVERVVDGRLSEHINRHRLLPVHHIYWCLRMTAANQRTHSPNRLVWFGLRVGGHPALSLHSSNEPGELSQWLCHDDSTIDIVIVIIIIIITSQHTARFIRRRQLLSAYTMTYRRGWPRSHWCFGTARSVSCLRYHQLLMDILRWRFGIDGSALSWVAEFLTNRRQVVYAGKTESHYIALQFGVPQGSVLGLRVFVQYVQDVNDIFQRHAVHHHLFADDMHGHCSGRLDDVPAIVSGVESCIVDIYAWCSAKRLQLNVDKTKLWHRSCVCGHLRTLPSRSTSTS